MATLSKNGDSSWRARGIVKRDAQHVHAGPERSAAPAHRKDKSRWCRGKVGRQHVLVVTLSSKEWWPRLIQHCSTCGREFDYYSLTFSSVLRRQRPEWVTDTLLKQLQTAAQEERAKRAKK